MGRAEVDGNERVTAALDAVIDAEARALLAHEADASFDGPAFDRRVMASIAQGHQAPAWWVVPRLALAGGLLSLCLAAAAGVLWWTELGQHATTHRTVTAGRVPVSEPAQAATPTPRESGEQVAQAATAPRGRVAGRGAPAGRDNRTEADGASAEPDDLVVASLQAPEDLRVPSLQVDGLNVDAVQVPSFALDRQDSDKKKDPASGPDKE